MINQDKTLNLYIMGKTGVGKSTLVNAIMEDDVAPTGTGLPVTKEIQRYHIKKFVDVSKDMSTTPIFIHIYLYDTVGFELYSNNTDKSLNDLEKEMKNSHDDACILYCVDYESRRFEEREADILTKLSEKHNIPFIVVITKCPDSSEGRKLDKQIKADLHKADVIKIMAKEQCLRGGVVIPAYGMDTLKEKIYSKSKNIVTSNPEKSRKKIPLRELKKYRHREKKSQRRKNQ